MSQPEEVGTEGRRSSEYDRTAQGPRAAPGVPTRGTSFLAGTKSPNNLRCHVWWAASTMVPQTPISWHSHLCLLHSHCTRVGCVVNCIHLK